MIRGVRTGEKVGGRPRKRREVGPWFKCRLRTNESTEERNEAQVKYRKRPNFMAARRALDRSPVKLAGNDILEVESKEFGNAVYQLDGEPKLIRKKRGVHHTEGTLLRVEDGTESAGAEVGQPVSGKAVISGQQAVTP